MKHDDTVVADEPAVQEEEEEEEENLNCFEKVNVTVQYFFPPLLPCSCRHGTSHKSWDGVQPIHNEQKSSDS